ncbi:acetyl-CoA carboxylase biotin carboxylase subunit [Xanthobacter tagetidis]|uniref:biotin carboxylase n=1 Tax=Xanthobacter tagetidis TaxID=60216 RepID=A0A3L7A3N8_9HYPH|nr:acetyl-CoA carboxylase biotin carboxylase subunit [Xanthobacter tagetidis]MBB6309953.1 acetyl-CoA carboxylase biotin carboxylase subunit [Xanthobacter tagetidis]RLP74665.1 acetyl-CoA carboxylase biotin carboxylase subunit [Xanthobacter tagetidis]
MSATRPIRRLLVANRGEIAARIIRTCRGLGIETVVTVSEADRDSLPARLADRAVCIGPARATASYLDIGAVVMAAIGTGCDALHPGFGFLSERAELAAACAKAGIIFVGPRAETIRQLGNKIEARALAAAAGVPIVPGDNSVADFARAEAVAREIGMPLLFKAAAGGGGRGMKIVRSEGELRSAFETARAEAQAAFGDGTLYIERLISDARHIEVQILADRHGTVLHLGERDCTLQRRHQKIVEEGPASLVPAPLVARLRQAAVDLARSVGYENAGTVEFIYDQQRQDFFFLEVNTRIQVEHPVTEELTGIDIVAEQLRVAAGAPLTLAQEDVRLCGHVIECRINAEAAEAGFRPAPGRITRWKAPPQDFVRLDTHCHEGYVVPPFYDSMLAKLIVHGADRTEAVARAGAALEAFEIEGVETTLPFLRRLLARPEFASGAVNTRWVEAVVAEPSFFAPLPPARHPAAAEAAS